MTRKLLVLALFYSGCAMAAPPKLLPIPSHVAEHRGRFIVSPSVAIRVPPRDKGAAIAANYLSALLTGSSGGPRLNVGNRRGAIRFVRKRGFAEEGYFLSADGSGVTVSATTDAGLLYGAVTVWQLATGDTPNRIPAVTIADAPAFRWRGVMLDSARHYQSPAFVKRLIDWMAVNKLNTLHWHLVDDQGWRLEIKKYPRLTDVSAWRVPATAPGAPPLPTIGGFYSQQQVRDIVAYAATRNVTIVPEIEMPGHALSAVRAYPNLGMGVPAPPGVESDWGIFPWLYNADEPTFSFLEDVLTEVMALFPSRYIHVGGDEAVKDQWKSSPKIQAQMKALGISDEDALQSWFMARVGKFLAAHGRRMIGWDEILKGGIPRDAAIMSWQGTAGAVAAAKAGHDSVLSPAPILYFDNRQGFGDIEPPGRGNLVDLKSVYAFEPLPPELAPEERKHVLGLQGNLWTEHVRTEERAAWNLFPRASAVAEIGWSHPRRRDFADFIDRLVPQMERMRTLGLAPAASAFAVNAESVFTPPADAADFRLSSQSGLEIRYTLDGSAPTKESPLYGGPIKVGFPARLRAATFHGDRPLPGAIDEIVDARSVRTRSDEQLKRCTDKVPLALEDDYPPKGPRAVFATDIFNPCWIYERAPVGRAKAIAITVGQVPFNFQVGKDVEGIKFRSPETPDGEFEVRAGSCDGDRIAALPLAPARRNPGLTRLVAPIAPRQGNDDLCVTYTAKGVNPMWAVDRVEILAQ
ncbi:MAG TPA: family 20 glycosylhydrolase [Sphingomicrobium sp.]